MSVVAPADVRPRLNKTSTADDAELQTMIDAAEAEFSELIGPPAPAPFTEQHDGPTAFLRYPTVSVESVTAAAGTALAATDYTLSASSGLLALPAWGGPFAVSYTAGFDPLPENYREVIVADVAGYFAATQRGGGTVRPSFPGEDVDFEPGTTFPVAPWPRIAALARRLRGGVIA